MSSLDDLFRKLANDSKCDKTLEQLYNDYNLAKDI